MSKQLELQLSLQKILILARAIEFEYCHVLIGKDFKKPAINNFAKRIAKDAEAIRVDIGVPAHESIDEYADLFWRLSEALNGLPVDSVRQFVETVETGLQEI